LKVIGTDLASVVEHHTANLAFRLSKTKGDPSCSIAVSGAATS
jgi:hypothetical protein